MSTGKVLRRLCCVHVLMFFGCGRTVVENRNLAPKAKVVGQTEKTSESNSDALVMTYSIVNQGNAELRLGPASPSCGCTVAKVVPEVVPPGGKAVVTVEGQPPISGSRLVQIKLATNDPGNPELILRWNLAGHFTTPKLLISPPEINLGILRPGQIPATQSITFDILEDRDTPAFIVRAASDPEFCRVVGGLFDESSTSDPRFIQRTYRYTLNFSSAPIGAKVINQELILHGGHDRNSWLTVPITGTVLPIVRAVPDCVILAESQSNIKIMILCYDHSSQLEVEFVRQDPTTSARVVRREADRIFFEIVRDKSNNSSSMRPLFFRVSSPLSTSLEVPVVINKG